MIVTHISNISTIIAQSLDIERHTELVSPEVKAICRSCVGLGRIVQLQNSF
jgi:hypothetical protein